MTRSLPLRIAASLDAYFENRFQHNLRNGILNLLAFLFLLIIGGGYLWHGWMGYGVFMLVLAMIAIVTGVWDIWIYKRNLPRVARQRTISPGSEVANVTGSPEMIYDPQSVTESTTRQLDAQRQTPGANSVS